MTTFPGSPRVRKGAIVALDPLSPLASVVVFQYNPAQLSRRLSARGSGAGGARSEAPRLAGPPEETIDVRVELDATDQLASGDAVGARVGIHPQLAALELILYPKSARVIANSLLAQAGVIEVVPPEAPLTLFVWGPQRVLPVQLTGLSIEEQAHDTNLNPVRAEVTLGLRVLSYQDLPLTNAGYGLFLAHQVAKEILGAAGSTTGVLGALGVQLP